MKNIFQTYINQKKVCVIELISDKKYVKAKSISSEKDK